MENQPMPRDTGLFIKDENGDLYFIRPEILELCRVQPEHVRAYEGLDKLTRNVQALQDTFKSDLVTAGFAKQVDVLGTVRVEQELDATLLDKDKIKEIAAGTSMCPW